MDNWDDDKLAEVVKQKHGEADKKKNQKTSTDIVSRTPCWVVFTL